MVWKEYRISADLDVTYTVVNLRIVQDLRALILLPAFTRY